MTIIQRKRRIVAVLDWVADRASAGGWLRICFLLMAAAVAGMAAVSADPANGAAGAAFIAYVAGRLHGDIKAGRQDAEIKRLNQQLANDQRAAMAATQAMRPVDQADLEPRGASDVTTLLPATRYEEADRG